MDVSSGNLFIRPFSKGQGEYSGEMKGEERHGFGTVVFLDGKTLKGEFKDGGLIRGIYRDEDGNIIANGHFSGGSNEMTGFVSGWARYTMDNTTMTGYGSGYREYEGEFKDGQENGTGKLTESRGPGLGKTELTGEFRHGIPWGYCYCTITSDLNIRIYKGEFGECFSGWTFIEGECTSIVKDDTYNYKSLRLYDMDKPNAHYQGYLEFSTGKFIGFFKHPSLELYGSGYFINDDELLRSNWDGEGNEITEGSKLVSMEVNDYKNRIVRAFQGRKESIDITSYDADLKNILEDIDFVLQSFKFYWPQHLPGNEIQLYGLDLHEEFTSLKSRIVELAEDIKASEFLVTVDKSGHLIKESIPVGDSVNNHTRGASEISSEEYGEYFEWPSTDSEPSWHGIDDSDVDSWPKVGVLKRLGYSVGKKDGVASQSVRSNLLDKAFLSSRLPFVQNRRHMHEWGPAESCTRLRKIANVLATTGKRERRRGWNIPVGRRDEDLAYLKAKYYDNSPCSRNFDWPDTDI